MHMERYRFDDDRLSLIEGMKVPFAVYQFLDKRVVTVALSDGFRTLCGYDTLEQAYYDMDHDMYKYTHPDDVMRVADAAVRFATEGGEYNVVYRSGRCNEPGYIIVHAFASHVFTEDGVRLAHVWYANEGPFHDDDLHHDKSLNLTMSNALREDRFVKNSHYDRLTGLPNMTYFFELTETMRRSDHSACDNAAIIYMDLCGLKYFNHKFGFDEGNKLLQTFGKLIADIFGNENSCHIAQDNFVVICTEADREQKLGRLFREFKEQKKDSPPVRAGIYRCPDDDTLPVSIACDRAKLACDSLKGIAKSSFCYYSNELNERLENKQYIIENFDRALSEKHIIVAYQPIIRAVNGKVCDEEALSRWLDPVRGMMSPADFIPALEEARLIYKLDLYVLDRVLEKIINQKRIGLTVIPHSINLSRSDFEACDIVEEIRKKVDDAGVPRDLITIEITESVIAADLDFMKTQIERFRSLGFQIWMDDFGSGYSSLDVLQTIKFDLIKFDMSFMTKLDEGESGKIILTELMKMATALGLDTVCEGVETESQVKFLKEIGCSKLQGYYYCKPLTLEQLRKRLAENKQIGYENPKESDYFKAVGGVNLNDLAVLAAGDAEQFMNSFNTLPMGIIEVKENKTRFARSNKSYRQFVKRFLNFDLSHMGTDYVEYDNSFMINVVDTCCKQGLKAFYDETMPDGSVVHSFARRIAYNAEDGTYAVAVAVLSITPPDEGTTYASIARALATDYYNIYYVNLRTEKFIEYRSPVGSEGLAVERHGENFFEECIKAADRIYEEDREPFFAAFSKEKILKEIDEQGVFNLTYRLKETGKPMYVTMKVTRMSSLGDDHLIFGISIVDVQMRHRDTEENVRREKNALALTMAMSEDYLSLYIVDPSTNNYVEYVATNEYESLGLAKEGKDFFIQGAIDGKQAVLAEDLPGYMSSFTKDNVMRAIKETGAFIMNYRLVLGGEIKPVTLRIASFVDGGREKLAAGVKLQKNSQSENT